MSSVDARFHQQKGEEGAEGESKNTIEDELTLTASEKRRVFCICTSSRVLLLIPAMPTPLLPKDPTASTIAD
jgi:hypothetical protein